MPSRNSRAVSLGLFGFVLYWVQSCVRRTGCSGTEGRVGCLGSSYL